MKSFVILGIAYLLYAILNDMIKRHGKKKYEQYRHHDCSVWVRSALRGKHRDHCLCWDCGEFVPRGLTGTHCPIANAIFKNCLDYNVVTPVYECPKFKRKEVR